MPAPTYSFDPNLTTVKDEVRLRVGDTDGLPQWFLADESINALISKFTINGQIDKDEVSARCAESIGALCAQKSGTIQQRNLKIVYEKRSAAMYELADRIRNLADPDPSEPANYGAISGAICGAPGMREYQEMLGDRPSCLPLLGQGDFDCYGPY